MLEELVERIDRAVVDEPARKVAVHNFMKNLCLSDLTPPLHSISACCGIFCDYRRGVIWSDVTLVGILCFFLVVQRGLNEQVDALYMFDDTVSNQVNEIYDEYLSKINIFGYITVVTSFASCIAAALFSIWIPAFQIIWLTTVLIASVILFRNMYEELATIYVTTPELELTSAAPILVGLSILITAFLYPHVAYVYEVYRGILTRETYPREERCCCH
jgi:lysylphosphatidylglycerol synthetase-like protein (DUF2156 family)